MIFKQRLFTALLGLLFATVLTGQASALYDPGVGRFCSRDPIGYGDGTNLVRFVHSNPQNAVDYLGTKTTWQNTKCMGCALDEIHVKKPFSVIVDIIEIELADNVAMVESDPQTGKKSFRLRNPLLDVARVGAVTVIFEIEEYMLECCVKKDLTDATFVSSEKLDINDSDKFKADRLTVQGGPQGWRLTRGNMSAYVEFAWPIPVFELVREEDPNSASKLCAKASGIANLVRKIKGDSKIKGGEKNA